MRNEKKSQVVIVLGIAAVWIIAGLGVSQGISVNGCKDTVIGCR